MAEQVGNLVTITGIQPRLPMPKQSYPQGWLGGGGEGGCRGFSQPALPRVEGSGRVACLEPSASDSRHRGIVMGDGRGFSHHTPHRQDTHCGGGVSRRFKQIQFNPGPPAAAAVRRHEVSAFSPDIR